MRILLINHSDRDGGAGVAVARLHKALLKAGADSTLMIEENRQNLPHTIEIKDWLPYPWRFYAEKALFTLGEKGKEKRFNFSTNCFSHFLSLDEIQKYDIINIHWVNKGFLHLNSLFEIVGLSKPLLITLHDMWYFTGGCHYNEGCESFHHSCGNCPMLRFSGKYDSSYRNLKKKKQVFISANNVSISACSKWLSDEAGRSSVLAGKRIYNIPNPIDVSVFKPQKSKMLRSELGVQDNDILIGFASINLNDKRKGFEQFFHILLQLSELKSETLRKISILFIGKEPKEKPQLPFKTIYSGYLSTEADIAAYYGIMDLFISTALQDNLPNTVMEAMSCGVPVFAYSTGGLPDFIDDGIEGKLFTLFDIKSFALELSIINRSTLNEMGEKARMKVKKLFSEEVVAKQYIDKYKELVSIQEKD